MREMEQANSKFTKDNLFIFIKTVEKDDYMRNMAVL